MNHDQISCIWYSIIRLEIKIYNTFKWSDSFWINCWIWREPKWFYYQTMHIKNCCLVNWIWYIKMSRMCKDKCLQNTWLSTFTFLLTNEPLQRQFTSLGFKIHFPVLVISISGLHKPKYPYNFKISFSFFLS